MTRDDLVRLARKYANSSMNDEQIDAAVDRMIERRKADHQRFSYAHAAYEQKIIEDCARVIELAKFLT